MADDPNKDQEHNPPPKPERGSMMDLVRDSKITGDSAEDSGSEEAEES